MSEAELIMRFFLKQPFIWALFSGREEVQLHWLDFLLIFCCHLVASTETRVDLLWMHENRLQFLPDLVPVSGQWTVVCPGLTWVQNKCFCSFKRFEPSIIIIIIIFSVLLKFSCWTVWLWLWLHTVFICAYCRCVYQKSRCLSWIKSTQILSSESETRPDSLLEYLFVPFDLLCFCRHSQASVWSVWSEPTHSRWDPTSVPPPLHCWQRWPVLATNWQLPYR